MSTDPVADFFNLPDEEKRAVYNRALQKTQESQMSVLTTLNQEIKHKVDNSPTSTSDKV